jgi:hypothetical protein
MKELTLLQILKNAFKAIINSEVLVLIILELAILLLSIGFSKVISKKLVKSVATVASIVIAVFYGINYIDTLTVFMDNVTTKLMEFIYFPSTLEFLATMVISFIIMFVTLANKKEKKLVKVLNVAVPVTISFLFLCIIEYMNGANIEFNEFAIFTEPVLMSLNELAIGLFVAWIISLIIYKVDVHVIRRANAKKIVESNVLEMPEIRIPGVQASNTLVTVNLNNLESADDEDIELPKLKSEI